MCGVWARTRFDRPVALEELLYPIASLRHRGPDGYGWFADDDIALVHTRLSIIDLEGGGQPLVSFDKRWVGIINGELYDYEAIRDRLIGKGITFETRSDSEVLLNLFALEGAASLAGLSGEFAFVFYDRLEKKISFGRDPIGAKPLFLERRPDSFTLASEIKALQDEIPNFNPLFVNSFLAKTLAPQQTCLMNVEHVWPGRVYTFDLKSKKLDFYIYQNLPLFEKRDLSTEEAEERLDTELRQAVRRRLRADVDVGCYLSGGIDSALITSIAVDLGAKPKAFTVGFADRDFDETSEAAHIASDLGIEHSVVRMSGRNFMPSLIESIVAYENPVSNPHGAGKNLLAAHAAKSVKVVLSGEGSDEWLGGYSYMRIRKIKKFESTHPHFAKNALKQYLNLEMGSDLQYLGGTAENFAPIAKKHFNGLSPSTLSRLTKQRAYRYMTNGNLMDLVDSNCKVLATQLRLENPNFQFSDTDLNLWIGARTDLLQYILANVGDRQEMSHSIEGRTPFLDIKVVKLASQIREKDLIRGLTEKYILRRVGKKYLHSIHTRRNKKAFFAPMKYLYLRENKESIDAYIEAARAHTPWLNWKHIDHLLKNPKRHASALENILFSLRTTLFSLGVLSQHLRTPNLSKQGFDLPTSVREMMAFRKL